MVDELHRIRQTPEVLGLVNRMRGMRIAVAMGIFSREHLAGIMLLGPRTSGRIYGSAEQNALQVLCGQLAVAIENAQLFTEVQNAKMYNETLLENLTTGVIASGIDERITVEVAGAWGEACRGFERVCEELRAVGAVAPARGGNRVGGRLQLHAGGLRGLGQGGGLPRGAVRAARGSDQCGDRPQVTATPDEDLTRLPGRAGCRRPGASTPARRPPGLRT